MVLREPAVEEIRKALLFYLQRRAPRGIVSLYLWTGDEEGAAPRDGDLDVAVLVDPGIFPDRRSRGRLRLTLGGDLVHALRDNYVDLVILNDAPPALGKRIVSRWARIHCTDPEADAAFAREVQLRAADLELYPMPGARSVFEMRPRPFLRLSVEELRKYLDHLVEIRPLVSGPESLAGDLSLCNDVRFGLLMVAQLVLDMAVELSLQKGLSFADASEAIFNLAALDDFSPDLVGALALFPGLRNALLHPHMGLEPDQLLEHLEHLGPVEEFLRLLGRRLGEPGGDGGA